jgi:hypothetical protein
MERAGCCAAHESRSADLRCLGGDRLHHRFAQRHLDCKSRLTTRRADCEPVRTCARDAAGSYATCIYRQSTPRPAFFRVRGLGGLYRIGNMACFHRFVASSKRLGMSQMVMQRLKSIGLIRSASPPVTRIGGVSDMRQRQGELDQQIRKRTRCSAHTTPQWTFRKMRGNLLRH